MDKIKFLFNLGKVMPIKNDINEEVPAEFEKYFVDNFWDLIA